MQRVFAFRWTIHLPSIRSQAQRHQRPSGLQLVRASICPVARIFQLSPGIGIASVSLILKQQP